MIGRIKLLAELCRTGIVREGKRWLLTSVGIALGVTSFTGILAMSRSISQAFEDAVVRTAGGAQFQVSNGTAGVTTGLVDELDQLPKVALASGTVQYLVSVPTLGRSISVFGILLGADHSHRQRQFGRDALTLFDEASFLVNTDSIALSDELAAELKAIDDTPLEVVGPKGERALVVRGSLATDGALGVFAGDVAVMDSDAAQHAFGELDRFHWIDVVLAPGVVADQAKPELERVLAGRAVIETPFGRGRRMEAMLGTLRWILAASAVIAMLVGVFLIRHSVATALGRRRDSIRTLRAIGATRWYVATAVLLEVLLVGTVGTLLGIALGIGFAHLSVGAFGEAIGAMYVDLPPLTVSISGGEVLASFLFGIGAVLLAAVGPSVALLRGRPGDNRAVDAEPRTAVWKPAACGAALILAGVAVARIAGELGFAAGVGMVGLFAACVFVGTALMVPALFAAISTPVQRVLNAVLGVTGRWVWHQITRYRSHSATTVGALAAAVGFTVALTTLLGSYRDAISPWVSQTLAADLFVTAGDRFSLLSGPTVTPRAIDTYRDTEGVAAVFPWRFVQVQFRGQPIIVQAAPPELIRRWHGGLGASEESSKVVVSETLAERFQLRVGSAIELPAPNGVLHVSVAAIRPDYLLDLGSLTLPWGRFERHFGSAGANVLFVDALPRVSHGTLLQRLRAVDVGQPVTVLTSSELRRMTDDMIDRSFALTTALQLLAALITVLAMVNATSASILDRRFELATWRALGMLRSRLIRLHVLEAGLLACIAGVAGVFSGALLGYVFVNVITPMVAGFRFALQWPFAWFPGVLGLTVVASCLTAFTVARSLTPGATRLKDRRS